jgi:cyclic-di-GMP-binding protein
MALNLSVPVSVKSLPKDIETNPKRARAWIEALPLTQLFDSAHSAVRALDAINRARLSVDDRLDIVEGYRSVLDTLLDELEAIYAYAPLPLNERQLEAFTLARTLMTECAFSYKMYLVEKAGKLLAFTVRKAIPLPVHRTMRLLRLFMWQCYKTYYPVPAGIWQEAHTLLLFADEQGFARDIVDTEDKASIADLHADMMMLSLAAPYRLMVGEVDKVSAILANHRGTVDIVSSSEGLNPQRLFVLALDQDAAPRVLVPGTRPPDGKLLRVVNPTRLVEHLQRLAMPSDAFNHVNVNANANGTANATNLLGRLVRLWGNPPKRQFRRTSTSSVVAVCAGIKAISYFANLEEVLDPEADAAAIREGRTLPLLSIPQDAISQAMGVEAWQIVNQSANGLRLHREVPPQEKRPDMHGGAITDHGADQGIDQGTNNTIGKVGITVGEVVGVRFVGARAWNIGVVRWLTVLEDNSLEFGVELISPNAVSATIAPTIGGGRTPTPALLIAPLMEMSGENVLTVPETYADLREYALYYRGEVTTIRATELIESTMRFDLFQYHAS